MSFIKSSFIFCFLLIPAVTLAQTDYTKYVNPFIGTGGHGHTYPGATVPFGMVQLSPDTRIDDSWDGSSGYHYSDSVIYGFSHTHLSGTGVPDYCDILLMPVSGKVTPKQMDGRTFSSPFNHQQEEASAGFYAVHLLNGNIDAALTATTRTGFHKYIFNEKDKDANIILDLAHRDIVLSEMLFKISNTKVAGFRKSTGWARNQSVVFVIEFSQPFEECISQNGDVLVNERQPLSGNGTRVCFRFKNNGPIFVKVALSPVTVEGAMRNMEAENPGWDFEKTKKESHDAWQKELKKIEVNGGTPDELKIFYTALYHCMVVPNTAMDVDSNYLGRDMKSHIASGFTDYTVFSLWDTFRAWHPLMTIINQKRTTDFINTFLVQYEQGRLLPVWELASNETECMIGYHSVSVIADAAVKGIKGFDRKLALTAMKKSAEADWRYGLDAYMGHGYIGVEDDGESVSKTLEYSYDDWCIAQMAHLQGNKTDEKNYLMRAQYWKNIFDPQTGFARPKRNGNWLAPFDPKEVNNHFTEANSWQYTFFVPQDVKGLVQKMGGPKQFESKLDELFTTSSQTTGREQADITGLIGQYAHGNEPSHHIAYLYNYVNRPQKTQEKVFKIMQEMYHNAPDGLIGNEDCGQMSAWFVLSAMGFYQVTPGRPEFQLGIPLFPKVDVHLENGKTFSVTRDAYPDPQKYFEAFISGSASPIPVLKFKDIMDGKTLSFKGTINQPVFHEPINVSVQDTFITVPLIEADEVFDKSVMVTLRSDEKNVQLFYSLNNADSLHYKLYKQAFTIDTSATIKAFAMDQHGRKSFLSIASLHQMPHPGWKITLINDYKKEYNAGGPQGLIDGMRGDENWRKGYWQGYWGKDFEAVIDMGKPTSIDSISAGFLQDTRAWILMPKKVWFAFSMDGINYSDTLMLENTISAQDYNEQIKNFKAGSDKKINARYIKIKAINFGKLPEWHAGAGGDAYIFVDEIEVK